MAAVVHLAAWLADMAEVKPESLIDLPVAVVRALGLNLDALTDKIPDADAIGDTSSLAGN